MRSGQLAHRQRADRHQDGPAQAAHELVAEAGRRARGSSSTGGQIAEEVVDRARGGVARADRAAIEAAQADDDAPESAAAEGGARSACAAAARTACSRAAPQRARSACSRRARRVSAASRAEPGRGARGRRKQMDKRLEAMRERTRAARMPQPAAGWRRWPTSHRRRRGRPLWARGRRHRRVDAPRDE